VFAFDITRHRWLGNVRDVPDALFGTEIRDGIEVIVSDSPKSAWWDGLVVDGLLRPDERDSRGLIVRVPGTFLVGGTPLESQAAALSAVPARHWVADGSELREATPAEKAQIDARTEDVAAARAKKLEDLRRATMERSGVDKGALASAAVARGIRRPDGSLDLIATRAELYDDIRGADEIAKEAAIAAATTIAAVEAVTVRGSASRDKAR
jgi:hypothetical protein